MKITWIKSSIFFLAIISPAIASAQDRPQGRSFHAGEIVSRATNKCLDAANWGMGGKKANVQQWSCAGQANQRWELIEVGPMELFGKIESGVAA